jgi:hypothetical protein
MAQDDDAVHIAGTGYVFTATVGATKPTLANIATYLSAGTLPTGFSELGHTDLEDVLAFGQDDGDSEVKGSWQNKSLREIITSEAIDYFVIKAMQVISNEVLTLYYGGGVTSVADEFGTPDAPAPQERAVLVVMVDGANTLAFYCPKVSIRREDAPEFATDEFTKLPLRFTILKASGVRKSYWMHADLGAA